MKFELEELVQEMLDQIPEKVWKSKTSKFLDPAMAGGQFVAPIEKRLREYGHSEKNIVGRVYGFGTSQFRVNIAMNRNKLVGQYEVRDFLEDDITMKFDVVVGNPPYQDGTQSGKIWKNFLDISLDKLKVNGYLGIVIPSSIVKRPDGRNHKNVSQKIRDNFDVIYLDMTTSKFFPDIAESICYLIIRSSKENIKTTVRLKNPKGNIKEKKQYFNNLIFNPLEHSIFKKVFGSKHPRIKKDEDINNSQKKWIKEGKLSETKGKIYKHPIYYSPSKIHYSKDLFGSRNKLKIMLTIAGSYYDDKHPDKNIFISKAMSGQGMYHILIKNKKEGKNKMSYLKSKLYRYCVDTDKTSGYNTAIRNLPELDSNRMWIDEEIYKEFRLNKKEIEEIEKSYP